MPRHGHHHTIRATRLHGREERVTTMQIKRTSQVTGITRTRDIDVTKEQLVRWEAGALIQDVMGHLSAADREFIITGITDDEWQTLYNR